MSEINYDRFILKEDGSFLNTQNYEEPKNVLYIEYAAFEEAKKEIKKLKSDKAGLKYDAWHLNERLRNCERFYVAELKHANDALRTVWNKFSTIQKPPVIMLDKATSENFIKDHLKKELS